jgi:uncharacterized RDD family membrane protein YckC
MPDDSVPGIGNLAGIGQRVVARLIDAIIMIPILLIFIGGAIAKGIDGDGDISTGALFLGGLVATAIGAAYEILMVNKFGATIGKRVMKIRVARLSDGAIPDMTTSVKRWLPNIVGIIPKIGSPLSTLIFVASLVLVFTDAKRQSVNDKFANTVVIRQ